MPVEEVSPEDLIEALAFKWEAPEDNFSHLRHDIDAVLCFGLVLKGETTHDHWVAHAATQGILEASLETDTPILFGVLTCNDLDQAKARALPAEKGGREDKGREVARAAIGVLAALDVADGIAVAEGSGEEAGR